MPAPQPADLRAKASRFRDIARAMSEPSAQATFNHYADRFSQQARDLEDAAADGVRWPLRPGRVACRRRNAGPDNVRGLWERILRSGRNLHPGRALDPRQGSRHVQIAGLLSGDATPHAVIDVPSSADVVALIPRILAEHDGCEHVVVMTGTTRLFAVNCRGERMD